MTAPHDDTTASTEDGDLRAQAIARLEQKRGFWQYLAWYVVINLFLWALWFFTDDDKSGFPWPGWVTLGMAVPLAITAFGVFGSSGMSEDKIQREMRKLR